jgi:hypothetical protein
MTTMREYGIIVGVSALLGMFGPTEIPFVVRRAGAAWTVDPEPYFALLLR